MVKFLDVKEDLVPVLKKHGVTEEDLYSHATDLYVGCKSHLHAHQIARDKPKGIGPIEKFKPIPESDMGQKFKVGLDFPFCYNGKL